MFERPPFRKCWGCGAADGVGILWVGQGTLERRCRACRATTNEPLPEVDKKVIYLDQLAVSELFKIKTGTRKPGAPHEAFWSEAYALTTDVVSLQ